MKTGTGKAKTLVATIKYFEREREENNEDSYVLKKGTQVECYEKIK